MTELSSRLGRSVTLADVPTEVWDEVARPGIDAVGLMGVWERSPVGAHIARSNRAMRADAEDALVDLTDDDVVGSAYCVRAYETDRRLGGDSGLASAREQLAARGVRLILDFVPNHVAPDHAWVERHPEYFISGTPDDLRDQPDAFIQAGGHILACGRDPYFPAWPEVIQLDASNRELRLAMARVVDGIADRCDGVRCDMAMLMLDDVFVRTWGGRARGGERPDDGRGYWPTIIEPVRATHPDFVFWAEAYWDLEPALIDQGFDACYDKRLYDRLVPGGNVDSIRAHIGADVGYQAHLVRFVENHDEPRAASKLTPSAHRAALAAVFTLPGVALLHEGEADGRRRHVPVTLGRRPAEPPDSELSGFVDRLLDVLAAGMRRGEWALVGIDGWPDNRSCERLLAWTWTGQDRKYLIVVNLSDERADGLVRLMHWADVEGTVTLVDRLSGDRYERSAESIAGEGLYVALDGRRVHLFEVAS